MMRGHDPGKLARALGAKCIVIGMLLRKAEYLVPTRPAVSRAVRGDG